MARTGARPHVWKVQGLIPHNQYIAWQRAKAQANFRKEVWLLTFEQFQNIWLGYWEFRGRARDNYVMSRGDPSGAWVIGNVACIRRIDYLKRQAEYRT